LLTGQSVTGERQTHGNFGLPNLDDLAQNEAKY